MESQRFRVYNKCKFDIGLTLENRQQIVIKAGSFQMMKADDIAYVESICSRIKYFSKRWLVAYDNDGNEIDPQKTETYIVFDEHPHLSEEEMKDLLNEPAKEIREYLAEEDDPSELHAIATVAQTMNLTADKLKVIKNKVPNMDLFVEDEDVEEEPVKTAKPKTTRTRTKK